MTMHIPQNGCNADAVLVLNERRRVCSRLPARAPGSEEHNALQRACDALANSSDPMLRQMGAIGLGVLDGSCVEAMRARTRPMP